MKIIFFSLIAMLFFSLSVFPQTGTIRGNVFSEAGEPIPSVNLIIKGSDQHSIADTNGVFEIKHVPEGICDIECKCMGYKIFRKKISIKPGAVSTMTIRLQDTVTALKDVEIVAKSNVQELKENPQTISVIDAKPLQSQSSGSIEIINKVLGVKVRQAGGLGSEANVSINGLSGKQIKFFLNGIPMDYFGNGLSINVLPVSLIDRIEVYKGVVPIELGADALGGAMNIVTKSNVNTYLDASYSVGSFNTHKGSLNAYHLLPNSHFFTSVSSFYNYSDNNYFVDVDIPDENGNPVKKRVKRFHDAYQNYLGSVEIGIINTKWAKLFSISAGFSGMHDNVQHNPTNIEQPYAKVTQQERVINTSIKFQKKDIIKNLDITAYAGFNNSSSLSVDTSIYSYTWEGNKYIFFGKPVVHPFVGEKSSNRKQLYFKKDNLVAQLNLNYKLSNSSSLKFNSVSTFYERKGHDTIQEKYYGRNYFQQPESMIKHVLGLAYEQRLFHDKLTSITSFKYYHYKAKGFEINSYNEQIVVTQVKSQTGFNQALRWRFNNRFLARTSYEYATRLPDVSEAFGDFLDVNPNPGIQPETSHNINSGLLYAGKKFGLEFNGFYRSTNHIIYLKTSRFFSQNQNLLKAETKGLELEMTYKPLKFISLSVNATYQDIRNKSLLKNSGTTDSRYYNARMPNIPYLFGNGEVRIQKENINRYIHSIQVWWNMNYVHEFYLYWATDGDKDKKATIPRQWIGNGGVCVTLAKSALTISAEIFNLTNEKAFDNFNIQKPGRNVSIKLRYFIQKVNSIN
jgi:outer membrane cobalamin receptor